MSKGGSSETKIAEPWAGAQPYIKKGSKRLQVFMTNSAHNIMVVKHRHHLVLTS